MTHSNTRASIETYLQAAQWSAAHQALGRLWQEHPTAATAAYLVARYRHVASALAFRTSRVALLRSFTIEPLVSLIRATGLTAGIDFQIKVGGFSSHVQEIVDPASWLYSFSPDVVILAVQTRDIAPDLWTNYADLSGAEVQDAIERVVAEYAGWVRALRARSAAHIVIHSLAEPAFVAEGVLDAQSPFGQRRALQEINRRLAGVLGETRGAYLLDYDGLIARYGRNGWYDDQQFLATGMPLASASLLPLVQEWMRYLYPLVGKLCKAVVVDLDNTLWGGIIGEEGLENIQIGLDQAGAPYRDLQRALLDLSRRGILLAVCSKNDESLALDALEHHPGMLIRPKHLAAYRINWNDKATNLRSLAAEINIGLDAIAFLDDNPVERSLIRSQIPEMTVIELPTDPLHYARPVREHPAFERLVVSEEDRRRGVLYSEQRERQETKEGLPTIEDFYWSLAQEVEVEPVTAQSLDRVAQLTQRTNQYNLTNRRYSQQQLADLCERLDWECYVVRVRDRFGDNGLVGAILLQITDTACQLDNFVLSCRVLGRTVETAIVAAVVTRARALGKQEVVGRFYPTDRNTVAREFFQGHGFALVAEHSDHSVWSLDSSGPSPACPEWIQLDVCTPEGETYG